MTASTDKSVYDPLESIILSGAITKENGNPFNGLVELTVPETSIITKPVTTSGNVTNGTIETTTTGTTSMITIKGLVSSGHFSINFSLPANTKSQKYIANLKAYEKDSSGKTTNKASSSTSFSISQIPTTLEISVDKGQVLPGDAVKFTPLLYDQAGDKMQAQVGLTIKDNNNKIFDTIKGETDSAQVFTLDKKAAPGSWTIFGVAYKITSEKQFQILEKEDIFIEVRDNDTLYIENTGNVPYIKDVLIKVGNYSYTRSVSLDVGASETIKLSDIEGVSAGEQSLKVSDGSNEFVGTTTITSRAVSSFNPGSISVRSSLGLWALFIVIFGVMALFVYNRTRKIKISGGRDKWEAAAIVRKPLPIAKQKEKKEFAPIRREELDFSTGKIKRAEQAPTIKGENQTAMVVCLKIKNMQQIVQNHSNVNETLEEINTFADGNKAVLYETPEFFYYILMPSITKTFKNGKSALSISSTIKKTLDKHNKFFKQRVDFGISLHLGEIVAGIEKNKVKFAALGDFLRTAKRIAEISQQEELLSEALRSKMMSDVRSERVDRESTTAYKVTEVINRNENKSFINDFMKRNPQEQKRPRWNTD
jgi:hypothetical protein